MVFAIPTDTCYWIGCHLNDKKWLKDIYKLKQRVKGKPISFIVKNFEELKIISTLTTEQVDFLENYKNPFTIVTHLKDDSNIPDFLKRKQKLFWIRVAEIILDKKVVDKVEFPIFLTSANISEEDELYSSRDVKKIFWNKVKILLKSKINKKPPSNVIRFIRDSLDLEYLRKTYED